MKHFTLFACLLCLLAAGVSCSGNKSGQKVIDPTVEVRQNPMSLGDVARMFAALPIGPEQMSEVYGAVGSSTSDGYDEEYTLKDIIVSPGSGVGGGGATKAPAEGTALRDLIAEYLTRTLPSTKSGADEVQAYLDALAGSDYQLYWPYSDVWDGETLPLVTFDPGFGADVNWAYEISSEADGSLEVVDSVVVTEEVAQQRPVWVINHNDDSAFTPLEFYMREQSSRIALLPETAPSGSGCPGSSLETPATKSGATRTLYLRSLRMLRNYDTWFGGGSEFWVKCGAVNDFTASTEAELKLYSPCLTEFMIVVPRSMKGKEMSFDAVLLSGFSNQLDKLAFLVTEDDGGVRTSWKCSAVVKIESRSYGFDIDIPYSDKDDIVWRGALAASFFQAEDEVLGRFGDVEITFALE